MQKTVPKRMKLATASVAPTKVKLLLVNAALTLKYAVLFYGNSILKKVDFNVDFFPHYSWIAKKKKEPRISQLYVSDDPLGLGDLNRNSI